MTEAETVTFVLAPLGTGGESDVDWHPKPRTSWKCADCGRFVAAATVRHWQHPETWNTELHGDCGRCGRVEVW